MGESLSDIGIHLTFFTVLNSSVVFLGSNSIAFSMVTAGSVGLEGY